MLHYLNVDDQLLGMLGEIYCKKFLFEKNIACVDFDRILQGGLFVKDILFDFKESRISIKIPNDIHHEICKIVKVGNMYRPRYLYDFLGYDLGGNCTLDNIENVKVENFMWIEAKSGHSKASNAQIRGKTETGLKVMLCCATGVLTNTPKHIGIEWREL